MDDYEEIEPDAAAREVFATLSRERAPDAALEDRIVEALRKEGRFGPRRWYRTSVPVPLAAAAGFLLFAAGAVAGQRLSHHADSAPASMPAATSATSPSDERPPHGGLIIRM